MTNPIKKEKKIKPLQVLPIPEYITGRLRKDGKPDRRCTLGMYMLNEYINNASGIKQP